MVGDLNHLSPAYTDFAYNLILLITNVWKGTGGYCYTSNIVQI